MALVRLGLGAATLPASAVRLAGRGLEAGEGLAQRERHCSRRPARGRHSPAIPALLTWGGPQPSSLKSLPCPVSDVTALRLAGCLAHVPQAVEQESAPVSSAMARGERLPRAGQTVRHNPTRGLVSVFLNSLGGTGKPDHLADPTELLVAPADVIVADCCRRHLPVRSSPSQRFSVSTVTKMSARVDLDNAELDRPQPAVTDDVALVTGLKRVEVRLQERLNREPVMSSVVSVNKRTWGKAQFGMSSRLWVERMPPSLTGVGQTLLECWVSRMTTQRNDEHT